MRKKHFVKNYLVSIAILIGLFYILAFNFKMYYLDAEYPMWMDVKQRISSSNESAEVDVLIIGDSRAKADFIPAVFQRENIHAVNLSVGGGTPVEGYYTLKKYLENNKKPKYLVLSYAPLHLSSYEIYWGRTVRFNFLDWIDYYSIYKKSQELENLATLGDGEGHLDWFFNPARYVNEINNGIKYKRWEMTFRIAEDVKNSNGHFFFGRRRGSSGLNQETAMLDFEPSILLNHYLNEILILANAENIPVYWYSTPFNQSSFNRIPYRFFAKYTNYLKQKEQQYQLAILNRLEALPDLYFGDPSHLYLGAERVTRQLMYSLISNRPRHRE